MSSLSFGLSERLAAYAWHAQVRHTKASFGMRAQGSSLLKECAI